VLPCTWAPEYQLPSRTDDEASQSATMRRALVPGAATDDRIPLRARTCRTAGAASPLHSSLCEEAARAYEERADYTRRRTVATKPIWKIEVGDRAPEFELLATGDTAGKGQAQRRIRLSEYRGKKNVMMAFY